VQAIIEDRGRQYVVHDGDALRVDYMADADVGSEVVFDRVLAVDGEVGRPAVPGAAVKATVADQIRGKKVEDARWILEFSKRHSSEPLLKLVNIVALLLIPFMI